MAQRDPCQGRFDLVGDVLQIAGLFFQVLPLGTLLPFLLFPVAGQAVPQVEQLREGHLGEGTFRPGVLLPGIFRCLGLPQKQRLPQRSGFPETAAFPPFRQQREE